MMTTNQTQILRAMLVDVEANNNGNKSRKINLPFAIADYSGNMLVKGHEVRLWESAKGELRIYDASAPFRRNGSRRGTRNAQASAPVTVAPLAPTTARKGTKAELQATILDMEKMLSDLRNAPSTAPEPVTAPVGADDSMDELSVARIIEAAKANAAKSVTVAIVRF